MKASELTGAQLDHWVARANGWTAARYDLHSGSYFEPDQIDGLDHWIEKDAEPEYRHTIDLWKPSTDWAQGGVIIEMLLINFYTSPEDLEMPILARIPGGGDAAVQPGPTHLVAAMRAYVASKFGEEIADEQAREILGERRYG